MKKATVMKEFGYVYGECVYLEVDGEIISIEPQGVEYLRKTLIKNYCRLNKDIHEGVIIRFIENNFYELLMQTYLYLITKERKVS